ncbi:MAG: AlpA family phage regulatory protein [Thermodesulfobacteriota bacterium]
MEALIVATEDRIVRKPELQKIVGLSDPTIRRLELSGDFPKRLRLGGGSCGWLMSEVQGWLRGRKAGR